MHSEDEFAIVIVKELGNLETKTGDSRSHSYTAFRGTNLSRVPNVGVAISMNFLKRWKPHDDLQDHLVECPTRLTAWLMCLCPQLDA